MVNALMLFVEAVAPPKSARGGFIQTVLVSLVEPPVVNVKQPTTKFAVL